MKQHSCHKLPIPGSLLLFLVAAFFLVGVQLLLSENAVASKSDKTVCSDAIVHPPTNEGPLQNPLKGFHIGFDASCCLQFPHEVYFGNYMATVGYLNFSWVDLEPDDDEWNWDKVERDLVDSAGSKQKHVIVQLNAEWTRGDREGRTPSWFLNDPRFEKNVDAIRGYESHKYETDFYQEEVKEFIAEFIHRFKDDPRIFIIQMGMVGYFGEFNVFPNDDLWLSEDIKIAFFEHYRDHMFGRVERDADDKLVIVEKAENGRDADSYNGISALTQVRYPRELGYNVPTEGIGYTNGWVNLDGIPEDGNNDVDIGNKDFNDPIDEIVTDDGRSLWTFGPVGGEWPPNREPAIEGVLEEWASFWGSEVGENYLKRGRYSFVRPPQVDTIRNLLGPQNWSLVPEGWNFFAGDAKEIGDNFSNPGGDLFRKWHRMMGYNYQLSHIQHYFSNAGSRINISFDLRNVGLAAFHFDWDVELAILNADNQVIQLISLPDVDMTAWKPGEVNTVSANAELSMDINQSGEEYRIGLRMVQPGATAAKDLPWQLKDRITYIVVSNEVATIDGSWDSENKLVGGWNVLDNVEFSSRVKSCDQNSNLCFPVKASEGKISMICL